MNQTQVIVNTKGQFVIPVAMRKYWDITPNTAVEVTNVPDVGIVIKKASTKPQLTDEEFMQILEETQGAWAGDDWDTTQKKLDKLAKQELLDLKKLYGDT